MRKLSLTTNEKRERKSGLTQRSVKDRFAVLKNHKAKKKEEDCASGISPEQSEVGDGMLQFIEQFDQAENERGRLSEEKKQQKKLKQ